MSIFIRFFIFIFYFVFSLLIIACTSSSKLGGMFTGDDEGEEYMDEEDDEEEDDEEIEEESFETDEEDEDSTAFAENQKSSDDDNFIIESADSSDVSNESDYTDFVSAESPQPKKSWIPLKKIPQTTWKHDGKWINAVYIVREGDQLSSITSLIYGNSDRQDELKSINPFLKRRAPKVGDKIYYNSPQRPNDRQKFSVYYEDIQQTPSTYDIPAGENIRKVSAQLLGHPDSWKEIWATNLQVESKGILDQPVTIQYWPGSSEPPQVDESPPMEELPTEEALPPSEEPLPEIEEPLPMDDESLEEAPFDEPEEIIVPPADPPIMDNNMPELPTEEPGQNQKNQLFNMGSWKVKGAIIGLILIIIGLWFAKLIRSKKGKSEFDFSQTNIDIDNIDE